MGKIMTLKEMAFVNDTDELKNALKNSICEFVYTKKDGSRRTAFGTTNSSVLDSMGITNTFTPGISDPRKEGLKRAGYISYYDFEKKGWRNCQVRNSEDVDLIASYETMADLKKAHPALMV